MWHEIEETLDNAEKSLSEFKKWAIDYANKKSDYQVALSKRLIERKEEGIPVTILLNVVKGEEDIAQLRLERDLAESVMKSAEKGTDFYKLKARLMEEQTSREWGQTKFQ